ncbi:hypothetical protein LguiB_003031 [Lonicera macranthoides]
MMESDPPFLETHKTLFTDLLTQSQKEEKPLVLYNKGDDGGREEHYYDLPLIDLNCLGLSEFERRECGREIAEAARKWGFFQVVNHGISQDVFDRTKIEQVKLFRQPFVKKANEKLLNLSTGCYRFGNPNATSLKDFSWSEAFHIPLSSISGLRDFNCLIRSPIEEFAELVSDLAKRIAEILVENLQGTTTSSSFFSEINCLPSSCYLRMNRYPPCPLSSKIYGLVPHTDSAFLTILYQLDNHLGGLQLLKDGQWLTVKPNPHSLIINIGDLFQAWSNGVYKSIEHKVVTNGEVERLSVAYFLCPSNETVIQSCIQPSIYRKFSFGEFRQQTQRDVKSTGSKIGLSRFLIT